MNTGKLATKVYDELRIPKGATSLGQFGDILSITVDGVEYEYQVQEWDSFGSVVRALEGIIAETKRTVRMEELQQVAA